MKLLVDENLALRLTAILADLFPDSIHVSSMGLSSAPDAVLWEFAKEHGFTFLTKDKDFAGLSIAWGPPPKVILVQSGNCSTSTVERIIRTNAVRFSDFERDSTRGLLILR